MIERTLLLVKPDGVYRALIGKIVSRLEDAGLKVVAMKMVWPSKETAGLHYADDKEWYVSVGTKTLQSNKERGIKGTETAEEIGRKVRGWLIKHLTCGPVVAMVAEGESAIFVVRKIVGTTEPRKADPSTIRGMYSPDSYPASDAKSRPILNIVHAAEDKKNSDREIPIWFKKSEILDYKRLDEGMIS